MNLVMIFGTGKEIFRIQPDGSVLLAEGAQPDDAARAFWAAVGHLRPTTLSTVKPGGAVHLVGDVPRLRQELLDQAETLERYAAGDRETCKSIEEAIEDGEGYTPDEPQDVAAGLSHDADRAEEIAGLLRRAAAALAASQQGAQVPVAPKKMERAVALDLLHAVYKHHGWKRAEGESMAARVHAIYNVTLDAGRNRYVAIPKNDAPPAQGIDLGNVHAAVEALLEFADHHESCGDTDAYNNADFETCGCGFDSAREAIWDALDGQRAAASEVPRG